MFLTKTSIASQLGCREIEPKKYFECAGEQQKKGEIIILSWCIFILLFVIFPKLNTLVVFPF